MRKFTVFLIITVSMIIFMRFLLDNAIEEEFIIDLKKI